MHSSFYFLIADASEQSATNWFWHDCTRVAIAYVKRSNPCTREWRIPDSAWTCCLGHICVYLQENNEVQRLPKIW